VLKNGKVEYNAIRMFTHIFNDAAASELGGGRTEVGLTD